MPLYWFSVAESTESSASLVDDQVWSSVDELCYHTNPSIASLSCGVLCCLPSNKSKLQSTKGVRITLAVLGFLSCYSK